VGRQKLGIIWLVGEGEGVGVGEIPSMVLAIGIETGLVVESRLLQTHPRVHPRVLLAWVG
jgi:hypothetical protein